MKELGGPDLVVREIVNGFFTVFLLIVGLLFLRFAWKQYHRDGRCSPRTQAALAVSSFLFSSLVVRAWAWFFLWQQTHGFPPTTDYRMALASMAAGSVFGSFLVYRITPPESGHWPWVLTLAASWLVPLAAHSWLPVVLPWSF